MAGGDDNDESYNATILNTLYKRYLSMRLSVVLTSRQPAVTHPLLHQRLFRRAAMALVKITSAERPAISTIIIIFICYTIIWTTGKRRNSRRESEKDTMIFKSNSPIKFRTTSIHLMMMCARTI